MTLAESNECSEWTIENLDAALAKLKRNKSRDFEGLANEIFKEDVIGKNLKESLMVMFNILRQKKGSRILLKNECEIFRTSVVRSILMNMIYESKYSKIDSKVSE